MNDLSHIKAGDEVARYSASWSSVAEIVKVDHVTPTGRIKIGTEYYSKGGRLCGPYSMGQPSLWPVTDEIREKVERADLLTVIGRTEWDKIPTDILKAVIKCLAGHVRGAK